MKNIFLIPFILILIISCNQNDDIPETNKNLNAIEVNQGYYFLLKQVNNYVAVILEGKISKGDGGYKYTCYWKRDNSKIWSPDNTITKKGEVYEKYLKEKQLLSNSVNLIDDGSKLAISCNDIKVGWSASNWIYINQPIEIIVTEKNTLDNIDFLDSELTWYKSTPTRYP